MSVTPTCLQETPTRYSHELEMPTRCALREIPDGDGVVVGHGHSPEHASRDRLPVMCDSQVRRAITSSIPFAASKWAGFDRHAHIGHCAQQRMLNGEYTRRLRVFVCDP